MTVGVVLNLEIMDAYGMRPVSRKRVLTVRPLIKHIHYNTDIVDAFAGKQIHVSFFSLSVLVLTSGSGSRMGGTRGLSGDSQNKRVTLTPGLP